MKKILIVLLLLAGVTTCAANADKVQDMATLIVDNEVMSQVENKNVDTKIRTMRGMADVFDKASEILRSRANTMESNKEVYEPSDFESQVIRKHNYYRAQAGLNKLVKNQLLTNAAKAKCTYMFKTFDFAHTSIDGTTYIDYIERAGYDWYRVGENIAVGYKTAESATTAWVNSPGHYANMITPGFKEIGVAYVGGYACVEFGTRMNNR